MSRQSSQGAAPKYVYVFTVEDGVDQKYKLVVKSALKHLGTRKMKRYLEKTTGVPAASQCIFFNDEEIHDDWDGDRIGLFDGAQLFMEVAGHSHGARRSHAAVHPFSRMSSMPLAVDSLGTSRCLSFTDDNYASDAPLGRGSTSSTGARQGLLRRGSGASSVRHSQSQPRPLSTSYGDGGGASDYNDTLARERGQAHRRPSVSSESAWIPSSASATARASTSHVHSHSARPSVASSFASSFSQRPTGGGPRASLVEAENEAMRRENALLREKLLAVERRAATSAAEWQLQERIEQLQDALLEKEAETAETVRRAVRKANVKEEELVRELDALRDERRRMRAEQARAEQEQRSAADALVVRLEAQRLQLCERDERIRQLHADNSENREASCRGHRESLSPLSANNDRSGGGGCGSSRSPWDRCPAPGVLVDDAVRAALDRLALVFNASDLVLDEHSTCVLHVDTDDLTSSETVTVLVTLDRSTERLYLYSTLLNELPASDVARLALYERLLEGALLGKDMAGAGVGLSAESGLVLMSVSVDVRRSDPNALAAAARPFVAAVREWISEVDELCAA